MIEQARQVANAYRVSQHREVCETIDALVAEVERLKPWATQPAAQIGAEMGQQIVQLQEQNNFLDAKCAELEKEVESLRKDAERYRWLRNECEEHHIGVYDYARDDKRRFWLAESQLDKEIDAAMQGVKE